MTRASPILFSGPMVRALLDGRKTQTRRLAWKTRYFKGMKAGALPTPWLKMHRRFEEAGEGYRELLWCKHAADLFPVYYKPIAGWEGRYAAGTDGLIYRMDGGQPSPLKGCPTDRGYLSVSLSNGGKQTKSVHRLIAETFYGPPPIPKAQVRHMDSDPLNNKPENLDWGTQEDNWADRKHNKGGMGENHHATKLTQQDVDKIREMEESQYVIAAAYGIRQGTVSAIKRGKFWADHPPAERNLPAFQLWRSPRFMPKWASRLTLEVVGTKLERLQDISDKDAYAEGASCELEYAEGPSGPMAVGYGSAIPVFRDLWESLHGPGSWDRNDEVIALRFIVHQCNVADWKEVA